MEQHYLSTNTIPFLYMFVCYIDPGTGSMLLQIIVSAIVGVAFFCRRMIVGVVLWIKAKLFKTKKKNESKTNS